MSGPLCAVSRAANRFAINGQLPGQCGRRHDLNDPAPKEGFELLRVERPEQTIEGGRRRRPVLQRQKAFEPRLPGTCPKRKVLTGVHVGETGADGNHQHFPEVIECAVTVRSRVIDLIEAVHQAEASFLHFVCPKDESRPDSSWVYNPYA